MSTKKNTKKEVKPATLAELAALHNVNGLAGIDSWKKLYNSQGVFTLPVPAMTEDEIADFDSLEDACAALAHSGRKRAANVILELISALYATHAETAEYKRQLESWAGEELAGYTQGNPARVAAQLCAWGIDSTAPGFTLDTPKNWDKRGYSLKGTARPLFVITPLFTPKDVKKAEQAGETVLDYSEPAEGTTEAKKAQKKRYTIHALYAPEDVEKVREIKRRTVKKSESATRAESMLAEPVKPARKAPKKKLSAMASRYASMLDNMHPAAVPSAKKATPKAEPVYMANDEYAQLALSL